MTKKKYAIAGLHKDETKEDVYWFIDCWVGDDLFSKFMNDGKNTENLTLEKAKKLLEKAVRLAKSIDNPSYKNYLRIAIIDQDNCKVVNYRNIK